jgi:hypothetical protein
MEETRLLYPMQDTIRNRLESGIVSYWDKCHYYIIDITDLLNLPSTIVDLKNLNNMNKLLSYCNSLTDESHVGQYEREELIWVKADAVRRRTVGKYEFGGEDTEISFEPYQFKQLEWCIRGLNKLELVKETYDHLVFTADIRGKPHMLVTLVGDKTHMFRGGSKSVALEHFIESTRYFGQLAGDFKKSIDEGRVVVTPSGKTIILGDITPFVHRGFGARKHRGIRFRLTDLETINRLLEAKNREVKDYRKGTYYYDKLGWVPLSIKITKK